MEAKQLNVRVPLFVHDELAELRRSLRSLGSKPTDGDLMAALIHAALESAEQTKAKVEAYVVYELAQEQEES
jgi:hypothetical protein